MHPCLSDRLLFYVHWWHIIATGASDVLMKAPYTLRGCVVAIRWRILWQHGPSTLACPACITLWPETEHGNRVLCPRTPEI
jgi:hypothetical protein